MTKETPVRDQDKFMLRLPDGMRERIAREASANNRSMNAEIVARLELSFEVTETEESLTERQNRIVDRQEALLKLLLQTVTEMEKDRQEIQNLTEQLTKMTGLVNLEHERVDVLRTAMKAVSASTRRIAESKKLLGHAPPTESSASSEHVAEAPPRSRSKRRKE
jgi:hypothetical protein